LCGSEMKFKMTMLVARMYSRTSCNTSEAPPPHHPQGSAAYSLGATDVTHRNIFC
jgi:hypothetical protein